MTVVHRGTIAVVAAACLSGSLAADGAGDREQEELLGWVRELQYQARNDEALRLCEALLEADPRCSEARVQRGIILLGRGQYEAARDEFSRALELQPGTAMALVGRGYALSGLDEQQAGRRDARRAIRVCSRSIERDAGDANAHFQRGLARLLVEETARALQDFITATRLDETLVEAYTERARIERAQGRVADAVRTLTTAVTIRPNYAVGHLALARVRFESRSYTAALADCDRALQINNLYAQAWHNRGLVDLQVGDFEQAVRDLTRAVEVDPDYASAHYYRGEAYLAAGDQAAARAEWEIASELDPDGWAGKTAAEMLSKLESAGRQPQS